jgi:hypothetical protein
MTLAFRRLLKRVTGTCALLSLLSTCGCSGWHSSAALPGLNKWKDERAVVKQAQNDPFPSPQQVGLK